MKRVFLLSCLISQIASASESLTLDQYLAEVRAKNPALQASGLRAEAQQDRVSPARAWDDPFFAVGPDEIPFNDEMGSVIRFQLSQTVPFPGKRGARGDAAQGRADAATNDTETLRRQITVAATQTYYRAYYNHQSIELNERSRRLIEDVVESTRARYRTGDSNHHEWLLAKVELSVLAAERLRFEGQEQALQARLNELRDRASNEKIEIPLLSFEDSSDATPTEIEKQPELLSLTALESSARAEHRATRLSLLPDLVVQGMAMKAGHEGEPSNWGLMVGVSVPLFFPWKQLDLASAARKEAEAAAADRAGLQNSLRTEIIDAQAQLKASREVVRLYQRDVIPVTELAAQNARSAYSARKAPLNQYIETLRVQRTQELELLAARIDVELARTRLRELLSNPSVVRLAPGRPSLFGAGGMGNSMGSDAVNMGPGMSAPAQRNQGSGSAPDSGGGGMSGMGGM